MASPFTEARKRQLARLDGARPPTARAAMALAKSQAPGRGRRPSDAKHAMKAGLAGEVDPFVGQRRNCLTQGAPS